MSAGTRWALFALAVPVALIVLVLLTTRPKWLLIALAVVVLAILALVRSY